MLPLVWNALVLLLFMTIIWCVSVPLRNVSIVDIVWGPGFALVAWLTVFLPPPNAQSSVWQKWLLPVLTTIWGLRLALHLARRNLGKPEDRRYAAFRQQAGRQFWWTSLPTIFWLQAALIWVISLPLQITPTAESKMSPVYLTAGLCLWTIGLLFETVGDWQLARFQAEPAHKGKVLDRGLWKYTRHPNYFGDCCVWWGLFLVALGVGKPYWTVIGPAVMTILLLRVSGVSLLERDLLKSKPGYADYVVRTSSFFPLPPRNPATSQVS